MGIFSVDLNNIDLNDVNFDEDDPKPIIHVIYMAWHITFKQRNRFKKDLNKKFMSVAWHPTRHGDWCMSGDKKKEAEIAEVLFQPK